MKNNRLDLKNLALLLLPIACLLVLSYKRPTTQMTISNPSFNAPFLLVSNEVDFEPRVKPKIFLDKQRQIDEQTALIKAGCKGLRQLALGAVKVSPRHTICQRIIWQMVPRYVYGGIINGKCFDTTRNISIAPVYIARDRSKATEIVEIFYDLSQFKTPLTSVRCDAWLDATKENSKTAQSHKLSVSMNIPKQNNSR